MFLTLLHPQHQRQVEPIFLDSKGRILAKGTHVVDSPIQIIGGVVIVKANLEGSRASQVIRQIEDGCSGPYGMAPRAPCMLPYLRCFIHRDLHIGFLEFPYPHVIRE
jgi:hypothetical protein